MSPEAFPFVLLFIFVGGFSLGFFWVWMENQIVKRRGAEEAKRREIDAEWLAASTRWFGDRGKRKED